ncbi:MAG TPA: transposase [Treponemataceae bacterium]|jgi:putative transposase|nr:transposase [Treponemataceae bacterium]
MKSKFSVEQIIRILREAEVAPSKSEVLQKHNISQQTFYRWKAKYQGMDIKEALRLRSLEKENIELKKMVAEQALQIRALEIVSRKNF